MFFLPSILLSIHLTFLSFYYTASTNGHHNIAFFLYIHVCRKKDCNLPGTHFFNSIIQSPKGNFLVFWSPWFFNLKLKLQMKLRNTTLNFNPKIFWPTFFLVIIVVTIECKEYMLLNDVTLSYTYTKPPKSK